MCSGPPAPPGGEPHAFGGDAEAQCPDDAGPEGGCGDGRQLGAGVWEVSGPEPLHRQDPPDPREPESECGSSLRVSFQETLMDPRCT